MGKDYYNLLGVEKTASAEDIKKAYRKMAMQYHPDKNPGNKEAEAKFKEINEAYEVLKDEQKRAAYDRYGSDAFSNGGMGGSGGGFGGFSGGFGGFDFSDIFGQFSDIFGDVGGERNNRSNRTRSQKGSDLRYDANITLEEAFSGKNIDVSFVSSVKCDHCNGTGSEDKNNGNMTCPDCGGSGIIRKKQGFFVVEQTCRRCGGTGKVIKNPCKQCSGTGRVNKQRTLNVKIPAGVDNGNKIKLNGEGEAGLNGGPNGDLFVFVKIREHSIFKRDRSDLYIDYSILPTVAMIGGDVEVPIIEGGNITVKIPAGTQHDAKIRVKGKGMPILNSDKRGDLVLNIKINIPTNLSNEEKELTEKLDKLLQKSKNNSGGFFKKWFN